MTATIYEVLGDLRARALDERDKGDKFERLIKTYLLNDPEWAARFSDVWMWTEWPGREGRPDTGIDLVAAMRDGDGYAAIQCKFYAPGASVSKGDIDSFLSASGGKEFTRRYIFDTAKSWSPNASDTLAHQAVPVQRVDIAWLDESAFDWSQYSWTTPKCWCRLARRRCGLIKSGDCTTSLMASGPMTGENSSWPAAQGRPTRRSRSPRN